MQHYIIVKFKEGINKEVLLDPITKIFQETLKIDGVKKVNIYPSCSQRENRYDLMIKMEVTKKGLENYDVSSLHKEWKEKYGSYILNKTIFDCEDISLKESL